VRLVFHRQMNLTELDKKLLELLALEAPWDIVCAEFHEWYGSPGALALRLFELYHADLVTIRSTASGESEMSPSALETHALRNSCYADPADITEQGWSIVATDAGFQTIKDRLKAE